MESIQNLYELRIACEYRVLRRMLRIGGIESVIFGLYALAQGTSIMTATPLGKGLAVIGLLLLAEGIWILATPRPAGLILEGLAFMVAGVWNLFISALGGPVLLLGLALLQLIWGIQYFRRYSRLSARGSARPSKALVKWLDESIETLMRTGASTSPDTIEFHSPAPWKAKLLPNAAIFVTGAGRVAFVLAKNEVHVEEGAYDGRMVTVFLQLGKQNFKGKMSPRSLSRLSAWRSSTQSEPEAVTLCARAAHAR